MAVHIRQAHTLTHAHSLANLTRLHYNTNLAFSSTPSVMALNNMKNIAININIAII